MTFSKEFKVAISQLPSSEKDKLILRLLRKDLRLANRLEFEMTNDDSQDERREILEKVMRRRFKMLYPEIDLTSLLNEARGFSGDITEHIFVTKDKFGEVFLSILLVNLTLEKFAKRNLRHNDDSLHKLVIYLINKIFKILELTLKLDEDLWIDLRAEFKKTADLLSSNDLIKKICINNQLDFKWLKEMEIPENISEIKKNLRVNGFLR